MSGTIHLQHIRHQLITLTPDVGGVWLENRYPGVACDIPSPCFAFLFEDNPNWSSYYASGGEINNYIHDIATKYRVRQFMKFRHLVKHAQWNEDKGTWSLRVYDEVNDKVLASPSVHCNLTSGLRDSPDH